MWPIEFSGGLEFGPLEEHWIIIEGITGTSIRRRFVNFAI